MYEALLNASRERGDLAHGKLHFAIPPARVPLQPPPDRPPLKPVNRAAEPAFDEQDGQARAGQKRARDDALCRG